MRPPIGVIVRCAGLLVIGVLLVVAWRAGPLRRAVANVVRLAGNASLFIEPAPLAGPHAAVPELAECTNCHELTKRPSDARCLSCHETIAERRSAGRGWHATFTGECADCHADHRGDELVRFDRATFNHLLAEFALHGAHQQAECVACHERPAAAAPGATRMQWQGLEAGTCADCHDDPHWGRFDPQCTHCHSERSWGREELRFDHGDDTDFDLVGVHASLECESCHGGATAATGLLAGGSRSLLRTCAGCHGDPHDGGLGDDCTACHGQDRWAGRALLFRHDRDAEFALTGRHADVPCTACHAPARDDDALAAAAFRGTPTTCAGCHASPHDPSIDDPCETCHVTAGWTGRNLVLDHSEFLLRGAHASVECAACHTAPSAPGGPPAKLAAARFGGVSRDCASCHEDPHRSSLTPRACSECHDATVWTEPRFEHDADTRFPLDRRHAKQACAACHDGVVFKPVATSCDGCHTDVAATLAGRAPGLSRPLAADPHSGQVGCNDCHDTTQPAPDAARMAERCATCHARSYAVLHIERAARIEKLLLLARAAGSGDEALLGALSRAARHDYVPAESWLRELSGADRRR